jgi:hypothetical protein
VGVGLSCEKQQVDPEGALMGWHGKLEWQTFCSPTYRPTPYLP